MEGRRQDSLGFNGDVSSKIPSSSSSTFTLSRKDHQILYNNNNNNNDSTLMFPDPTSTTATRSIRSPPTASPNPVRYRECLKNHAATMGGLVLDGCGEFMPMGAEGTPGALKCAACECHRNFHRREIEGDSTVFGPESTRANPNPSPLPNGMVQRHFRGASSSAPVMMSFGGPAESSSEDLNVFLQGEGLRGKKRFRNKFSSEQKEMMTEFAEKLGWKIQKQDEQELQQFCSSIGIKRKVFKVWMHNNKQAMKKKQM